MIKYLTKKGLSLLLLSSLLITSLPHGMGTSETTIDESLQTNITDTPTNQTTAIIHCTTYGFTKHDTTTHNTMTTQEAYHLKNLLQQLQHHITTTPTSPTIKTLQETIITYAKNHQLLPPNFHIPLTPQFSHRLISLLPPPRQTLTKAAEYLCNYVSFGTGSAMPVIVLPRLIPILLTPIPRFYLKWSAEEGITSCGGIQSHTGFIAHGYQEGTALGFWGIGFSIFLTPIMEYGIFGYALYASVEAQDIELWPPNYPPEITPVYPPDNAVNIPINTPELSFALHDPNQDLMSYSITTTPYCGSGNANAQPDGTYSIPLTSLEGTQTYQWTIMVTDGENTQEQTYYFTTERVAPEVTNPVPLDGQRFISVNLTHISFHLQDPQGDHMDYTVETSPDIGSSSGTGVSGGTYTVPVEGLEYMTEYTWYINVTDGIHWKHQKYAFQTEPIMVFDPFLEGWQYRKNITIDHTKVAGDLTNFPVLISLTDTDLRDKVQPDGDDILFMNDSGIAHRLWHEIESYEYTTGEIVAWVNVSNLNSSTNTSFFMYYGNPNCTEQQF
ncbi:MAG: DUF2341 domain-containing protein, partial [Candidatus Thermoplasmatota archaeon]|nr:DUF2341 domain-containing protein [Candidatus Thermoplasmatota archaeon]